MPNVRQLSFSSGEVTPSLWGRVDLIKYATGLKTCENYQVMRHGGVQNRPGSGFVAETKDSSVTARLIPFIFNSSQTYVLEFGNLYMRVHKDGAQLTETAKNITGATAADPCVLTVTSHGYSNGDEVQVADVGGMTELNGRNFKVANVITHTFELQTMDSVDLDATAYTAYTSGGMAAKVYEIVTTYVTADLSTLQYVQEADIVTIVHPNYPQRELARTGDTSWTIADIVFAPEIDRPANLASIGSAGANNYKHKVTAIDSVTGEESLVGYEASRPISGATNASPVVITISDAALEYDDNNNVDISGVGGMVELNGNTYNIDVLSTTTFALYTSLSDFSVPLDGTAFGTYTSGGVTKRQYTKTYNVLAPATANPIGITWDAVTGASKYNIYLKDNGIYGWVGSSVDASFENRGATPDFTINPPDDRQPFAAVGDYPSTVTLYQQRMIYGNTDNNTEGVWTSRTGLRKNFNISSPLQDDDAVTFSIVGREVNAVEHMLDIGKLVLFTSTGEWSVEGDASGTLTPTAINLRHHTSNGSGSLRPIIADDSALYVQARGSVIRDLAFDLQVDSYRGNELSIFSAHLFDPYTIVDWEYQQVPHSIVWAVRSDGVLLGMTYLRSHQVFGWHRHTTEGTYENVTVVPEGSQDVPYFIIKRTIDGKTVRYIERMKTRQITDIVDAVFMDSSLSYDGRNTGSTTMTLSGGSTWAYDEDLTLTASASFFVASDVDKGITLTDAAGGPIRCVINAYTSATVVTVRPHKDVPADLQGASTLLWAKAIADVSGLWHLEGESMSVLADGFVSASPNNDAYELKTVTNGTITLDEPHSVIHAGLPYTSDMETLSIERSSLPSLADKKKHIDKLTLLVEATRGIFAGVDEDRLTEQKMRNDEDYESPIALATGEVHLNIRPDWSINGRVIVRQIDPLPVAVLSIVPSGYIAR